MNTSALIGGLVSVFIILVLALVAVMWYKRPAIFVAYFPKWSSSWNRSSMDQDSPTRGFANSMFNQEITMSTLEVFFLLMEKNYILMM